MGNGGDGPTRPQLMLGTRFDHRGKEVPVTLAGTDAARHLRVLGTTGVGKSKFLASLFVQLLNQGVACSLIDPHGDLASDILALLYDTGYFADPRAYSRLWYIPFNDPHRFPAFNVLQAPYEPHAVARNLLEAWKRAWSSLAGGNAPNLENVVLASCLLLVEHRLPITALDRLLADPPFRAGLLRSCSDPDVIAFFDRFEAAGKRGGLMTESTLKRAFMLLFSPALRYSLGQTENRLEARTLMDQGISCLFDLSGLDEDTQRFLGSLLCVNYEVAALSRADLPEERRRPHRLFIDEFAMFSATSETALERVLALTRKYGLSLCLAHQTVSQTGRELEGALGNALSIYFRVSQADAGVIAPALFRYNPAAVQLAPVDPRQPQRVEPAFVSLSDQRRRLEEHLTSLPPRQAFIRLGDETVHFWALGVPAPRCSQAELEQVKEHYARMLLTPLAQLTTAPRTGAQSEGKSGQPAPPEPLALPGPNRRIGVRRKVALHATDDAD